METFYFTVTLKVAVTAFDVTDATDMLSDSYGAGALYDEIDVKSCKVESDESK